MHFWAVIILHDRLVKILDGIRIARVSRPGGFEQPFASTVQSTAHLIQPVVYFTFRERTKPYAQSNLDEIPFVSIRKHE